MRRTAVAVMGLGCAVGVFAAGGLSPAGAATMTKSKQASAMQTVQYDGYSVTVPASWQVFHLDTDPGQCVRYDINAVYLGSPGANQNCPSNLMGRAQTITITPAGVSKSGQVSAGGAAAQGGLVQSPPPSVAGRRIAAQTGTFSQLNEYGEANELRASVPGGGLSVTGTWGSDSTQVTGYVRSIHRVSRTRPGRPISSGQTSSTSSSTSSWVTANQTDTQLSSPPPPVTSGTGTTSTKAATSTRSTTSSTGTSKTPSTTTRTVSTTSTSTSAVRPTVPKSPLAGFDTCTAPSLNAMKAWKSKYSAIGIYIGGQNMACDYGNLSASWVKAVHAMGWSLLPLYVGLQAPCNNFADISSKNPVLQGTQAADTAVGDAASFGLGKGSPIYFDMESYNNGNSSCKSTVLQFLDAWTKEVHAKGYVSGVYSSASTGVTDLASAPTVNGHAMNQPDALWFALWDKKNNLSGTPYLLASDRWATDRVKQYQGNQNIKVGGYSLNIDADWVGGAVSPPRSG
jgi:Rv2525c-like, glycoside hydrolase-like domain